MKPQGVVQSVDERAVEASDDSSEPLDVDRADLLGLGLRVARHPGLPSREQYLERMHALDARGDGDDG